MLSALLNKTFLSLSAITVMTLWCLMLCGRKEGRKWLFNDALNTFYLRLYVVRHMIKDDSDSWLCVLVLLQQSAPTGQQQPVRSVRPYVPASGQVVRQQEEDPGCQGQPKPCVWRNVSITCVGINWIIYLCLSEIIYILVWWTVNQMLRLS